MKLNRSQKASLLKEIGNLISYFQTFEHMDVDKLINIMKEKYSSWKDTNVEELHNDVNSIVTTIQNLIEEKVVDTDIEYTTTSTATNYNEVEVTVTGSDVSTASEDYLSSEPAFFEDELISTKPENEITSSTFTFTGFSSDNFQDTNAITISPKEFWYDEENKDDFND